MRYKKYSLTTLIDKKKISVEELAKSITTMTEPFTEIDQPKMIAGPENKDSIRLLNLNGAKVYVYAQAYAGLNLYKMLNYVKPELIMLQLRPDDFIQKQLSMQSLTQAQKSLKRPCHEIIPDHKSYKGVIPLIRKAGLYWGSGKIDTIPDKEFMHYDRINSVTAILAGIWGIQHGVKDVVLGDMPRHMLYRKLCNSYTLMQLQTIYLSIMKSLGANPDIISKGEPELPIKIAYNLYPHIFVETSTNYMANLIQKYSKEYSRIFFITGRGHQNLIDMCEKGVHEEPIKSLRHKSVVREDSSEIVIDKIALLDTFYFSDQFIRNISKHTSLYRIEKFVDELIEEERKAGSYVMSVNQMIIRKDQLIKLYAECLKKYSTHGNKS